MWERLLAFFVVICVYGLASLEMLAAGHEARAVGGVRHRQLAQWVVRRRRRLPSAVAAASPQRPTPAGDPGAGSPPNEGAS